MSRLTSAQIIELGEYLQPDFDPSTLTVAQLLGIFGFHNVTYPTPYTKPKLVALFNNEIKTKATKYKKEQIQRQNSQASAEGIKDGVTGELLEKKAPTTRRVTRRTSRAPSSDLPEDIDLPRPEPKRRRSTAEPSLGGPSRRRTTKTTAPVLVEESETDEPVRKVGRSKKSSGEAGAQARRASHAVAEEEHDSGWEDNNIFQSGTEDSPVRPSPHKPRARRSSAAPTRSKKATSVPPQFAPPSPTRQFQSPTKSPAKRRESSVKPPESDFDPQLPVEVVRETRATPGRRKPLFPEAITEPQHPDIPEEEEEMHEPYVSPLRFGRRSDIFAQTSPVPPSPKLPISSPKEEIRYSPAPVFEPRTGLSNLATPEKHVSSSSPRHETPVRTFKFETPSAARHVVEQEVVEEEQELISESGDEIDDSSEADTRLVSASNKEVSQPRPLKLQQSSPLWLTLLNLLRVLAVAGIYQCWQYKAESAPMGFCLTGQQSNSVLGDVRAHRAAVEACNRENRTLLYLPDASPASVASPVPTQTAVPDGEGANGQLVESELCPLPYLLPIMHPDSCTPCPQHATCTESSMTCDTGYNIAPPFSLFMLSIPQPNGVDESNTYTINARGFNYQTATPGQMIYGALSWALDGLPGLGPVAIPPRCIEDQKRKKMLGGMGRAMESVLAAERGRRLCDGVSWGERPGTDAEEAKKWGLELEALKDGLQKKMVNNKGFDDMFNEAVQQLLTWGGVFMAEDDQGKRYLAHYTPQLDWTCAIKVKARQSWDEWQKTVLGLTTTIAAVLAFRRRHAQNAIEDKRVASLVQIALDLLRNQELAHHTDPVSAPHPYLSSLQLRDLILQDEHSVNVRQRLWTRVERVVEGNANIRTNLEEVTGGDEMRVWRWVGSAGKTLPSGYVTSPKTPRVNQDPGEEEEEEEEDMTR